ncbi:dual OB domain-containing protein [Aeromonas veronii]|uniref:dual OB domain-containing protein n=1 Tax=Aeromonas veronii TaxID=654 RepID=UPI003BF4A2CC
MSKIVITDLTRFHNKDLVCMAGIDIETGSCIRPMPYIRFENCEKLKIIPGSIIEGKFKKSPNPTGPHTEDHNYEGLTLVDACNKGMFYKILNDSCVPDVSTGFKIALEHKQKHIPIGHNINTSIITIKVNPRTISIIEDKFKPGKLKVNFQDGAGTWFNYLPITDLGFHDFAQEKHGINELDKLNYFINSQETAFLRVGLSRAYQPPSQHNGYWIQVNGIYTFPNYYKELREY